MATTTKRPAAPSTATDPFDAFLAQALCGRVSYAQLLAMVAVAEAEMRKSDSRLAAAEVA